MSGSSRTSAAAGGTPQRGGPKAMSSKLANMKFMQRTSSPLAGAAASPAASDSDRRSSSAKRIKTWHGESPAAAGGPSPSARFNNRIPGSESATLGPNTAETMWTLPGAGVSSGGGASLTANRMGGKGGGGEEGDEGNEDDEEDEEYGGMPWEVGSLVSARRTFGNYRPKAKASGRSAPASEGEGEESAGESEEDDEDGGSTGEEEEEEESTKEARRLAEENLAHVRAALADKKRGRREHTGGMAKERRKKDVKLNKPSKGRISK